MNNKTNLTQIVILDSSAFIALLAKENGHEITAKVLPNAVMSSVNIAEAGQYLIKHKSYTKTQVKFTIDSLLQDTIPFDEELAYMSAELILQTNSLGLSLGDRACLALEIKLNAPIYTADKIWSQLNIPNLSVILIR